MADREGPPPAPAWVPTFCDLMSLLLTFFILLLTFSTPREERLFELRGSIQGTFGIFTDAKDDRDSFVPPSQQRVGRDQRNPYAPAERPRFRPLEEHEPNAEILRLRDQSGEAIEVEKIDEGWRVRIADTVQFEPASDRMRADGFDRLGKVARAVQFMPYHLMVVAFTGGAEIDQVRRSGQDPMDLALRRAAHVADRLVRFEQADPAVIGIAGYGPPVGDRGPGRVEFVLVDRRRFLGGR